MIKSRSILLFLVTVIVSSSCSPGEKNATENAETIAPPIPSPTLGLPPTPEEVKSVFSVVSSLKVGFEKAIQEKNLDLFRETREKWNQEEKKLNALSEKYGGEVIQKSPVGDCRQAFLHLFQTYVLSSGGMTGSLDAQEKRNYEEDKAELLNLFKACETSAKTGLSSFDRSTGW